MYFTCAAFQAVSGDESDGQGEITTPTGLCKRVCDNSQFSVGSPAWLQVDLPRAICPEECPLSFAFLEQTHSTYCGFVHAQHQRGTCGKRGLWLHNYLADLGRMDSA
jgi:hypothetical protein